MDEIARSNYVEPPTMFGSLTAEDFLKTSTVEPPINNEQSTIQDIFGTITTQDFLPGHNPSVKEPVQEVANKSWFEGAIEAIGTATFGAYDWMKGEVKGAVSGATEATGSGLEKILSPIANNTVKILIFATIGIIIAYMVARKAKVI